MDKVNMDKKDIGLHDLYREGYLNKAGKHSFQAWKKRWVVLRGTVVKYYPNQDISEVNTLGAIDMSQVTLLGLSRGVRFGFELSTRTRTYFLSAKSEQDRDGWIHALETAMKIASDKEQAERAAEAKPAVTSPFAQNLRGFFKETKTPTITSTSDNTDASVYETIDSDNRDSSEDIEKIMAEAELISNIQNTKADERQKFKEEVMKAPEILTPRLSPHMERSPSPRLSAVAEDESEDDLDEEDAMQVGINNLLSKMSLESLDSIDSENLLDSSDGLSDIDESELNSDKPKESNVETVDGVVVSVVQKEVDTKLKDTVDGSTKVGPIQSDEGKSAVEKMRDILGLDDNYRCSVSLEQMQKAFNVEIDNKCKYPAFELLKKVLGPNN